MAGVVFIAESLKSLQAKTEIASAPFYNLVPENRDARGAFSGIRVALNR
jgi:hypothetical protein